MTQGVTRTRREKRWGARLGVAVAMFELREVQASTYNEVLVAIRATARLRGDVDLKDIASAIRWLHDRRIVLVAHCDPITGKEVYSVIFLR